MCFFDQHRFACGDWKWGHFRQHCSTEYRIGETCGIKLVQEIISADHNCKLCQKIDTKKRRRAAEVERLGRWQREPHKWGASIEKSVEMIRGLDGEIYELNREKFRMSTIGPLMSKDQSKQIPKSNSAEKSLNQQSQIISPVVEFIDEQFELKKKENVFLGLPITFENATGPATVMAVPDSGSDHNVISLDLALHLGLELPHTTVQERQLSLIDGSTVASRGTVSCFCRFGITFQSERKSFYCVFQVLNSVISPLIMSASFLEQTETMTKYRQRLVVQSLWPQIPRICALGRARRRIHCAINSYNVEALVDSGSDIDVLSLDFVLARGWEMKETDQDVILASGRRKIASGICVVQLSIGKDAKMVSKAPPVYHDQKMPGYGKTSGEETDGKEELPVFSPKSTRVRHVIESTFYVLAGISIDALIGAASIESLNVFSDHKDSLFTKELEFDQTSELHRIGLAQRARRCASKLIGESMSNPETVPSNDVRERLNQADQRENSRREMANSKSATLVGEEKVQFDEKESAQRREYDAYRAHLMRALSLDT